MVTIFWSFPIQSYMTKLQRNNKFKRIILVLIVRNLLQEYIKEGIFEAKPMHGSRIIVNIARQLNRKVISLNVMLQKKNIIQNRMFNI